jgi:hypothetical protein
LAGICRSETHHLTARLHEKNIALDAAWRCDARCVHASEWVGMSSHRLEYRQTATQETFCAPVLLRIEKNTTVPAQGGSTRECDRLVEICPLDWEFEQV